jgi:hypothetical protein
MVVHIHSLGSIWQPRERPSGISLWNTSGVDDGRGLRPRSVIYGQVAFSQLAKVAMAKTGNVDGSNWIVDLSSSACQRSVRLVRPASRQCTPEVCLVRVTDQVVGRFEPEDCDPLQSQIISFSAYRDQLEAVMLAKPFTWIKGSRGSATLCPTGSSFRWQVKGWS